MDRPPAGLIALSGFFTFGAVISALTGIALLTPGGTLEPMWRLNPQAQEAFRRMGSWAPALMAAVSLACALAARGVWRRVRWGHRLALAILVVNLLGDVGNALLRGDTRTLVGLPIGAGLIAYLLSPRVRARFGTSAEGT
jgi:hypothetical protein